MDKLKSQTPILGISSIVGEFWSWAYSDILSNSNRGKSAEFLVGNILGVLDTPRIEWDAYDFMYQNNKIEVKSSAYLQSWHQTKLSTIRFDIAPKIAWDATTNTYSTVSERVSDCYIFCLFISLEKSQANILDTEQWRFYIVNTKQLDEQYPQQKSIGLSNIKKLSSEFRFNEVKITVDRILNL